jgi:hypothetical protein
MEIDYLKAITNEEYFDVLANDTNAANKDIFIKLFKSSLAFIKTKDYIFNDGFVDPEFIQWQVDWILSLDDSLIEELESYIDKISSLVTKNEGYWFNEEMTDVFEGEHFFPENFAISSMVYCLNGLFVDESKSLYLATRFESFIYFTDLVNNSLFKAEYIVGKRKLGLAKSKAARQLKNPIVEKIDELAQYLWNEIPTLSSSVIAENIQPILLQVLNAYREYECQAFYEQNLYSKSRANDDFLEKVKKVVDGKEVEVKLKLPLESHRKIGMPHPSEVNVVCIPLKIKSIDAIRKQITPLRPKVKRVNNMKYYDNEIKKLLTNKLACSNKQCKCQNP